MRRVLMLLSALVGVMLPHFASAESTSTNYILWDDSVNAGGDRTTSANYTSFGSVADLSGDKAASANFQSYNGFEAIYAEPIITMSVSSNAIALSPNPLTTGAVSTGTTTVSVSTNADFGYTLTATALVPFQNQAAYALANVGDGSVTAGSEEFGIAVSGSDAAFGDDRSVTSTPRVIASRGIYGANRAATVTAKAAITNATASGSYAGTVIFIATGNY